MATQETIGTLESYRSLFDQNPIPMLVIDPETLAILAVNEAAIRKYGFSEEEFLHLNLKQLQPEEAPSLPALPVSKTPADESHTSSTRHRKKNGTLFEAQIQAKPLLLNGRGAQLLLVGDRLDGAQASEELQLLFQAIQHSPNSVIITDKAGRIKYVNRTFTQASGRTAEETDGEFLTMLKEGALESGDWKQLWETLLAGGEWRGEFNRKKSDGQLCWESISISPIRNAQGRITHFISVLQDITARKQVEAGLKKDTRRLERTLAELTTTQNQLIQQERLHAVGEMASGIAHDFNNALTSILGFSELLLLRPDYLDDKSKVMKYVTTIHNKAKEAAEVVSRLREFYRWRHEGDPFLPVDLNTVVQDAVSLTRPRWKNQVQATGSNIDVRTHLQDIPAIAGIKTQLDEVLTNLILNATDAMPGGGTLVITTFTDGKSVAVAVKDSGTGMTEDVRKHCLEPFFSTKPGHGTGLGLSVVYGVVMRHDGTIEIATSPKQGTTFTIQFPRLQQDSSSEENSDEPEEDLAPLRSLDILLVDDELLVLESVSECLMTDGHRVTTACNGQEALEKLQKRQFDLLVTDRGMPGMNGDQLAVAAKRIAPRLPIILLTGFGDIMDATGEMPPGIDLVVGKPVGLVQLRQAMATALNIHLVTPP